MEIGTIDHCTGGVSVLVCGCPDKYCIVSAILAMKSILNSKHRDRLPFGSRSMPSPLPDLRNVHILRATMVNRIDPARVEVIGGDEASKKRFIESDYRIRSGLCPNG